MPIQRLYSVKVIDVFSGDDIIMMADLGVGGLFMRVRARLKGVDAPSAFRSPNDSEAGRVRSEIRDLVMDRPCRVELHSEVKSNWIVTLEVTTQDGVVNVNEYLISKGYVFNRTEHHASSRQSS